jgi:RNA polymerase sigma-70 factor, ECF subfamily
MDDAKLVQSAREGDSGAWRQICSRYGRRLLARARRIVPNREDAEDIVQETCAKAFQRFHTLDDPASFEGWINRMCVRTALDEKRKRAALKAGGPARHLSIDDCDLPGASLWPLGAVLAEEMEEDIRRILGESRAAQYLLHYVYQYTAAELAANLYGLEMSEEMRPFLEKKAERLRKELERDRNKVARALSRKYGPDALT